METNPNPGILPRGYKPREYIRNYLPKDSHIFSSEFPASEENVDALVLELQRYPECYHQETDSFNLDKIGEWISKNINSFREQRKPKTETLIEERVEQTAGIRGESPIETQAQPYIPTDGSSELVTLIRGLDSRIDALLRKTRNEMDIRYSVTLTRLDEVIQRLTDTESGYARLEEWLRALRDELKYGEENKRLKEKNEALQAENRRLYDSINEVIERELKKEEEERPT